MLPGEAVVVCVNVPNKRIKSSDTKNGAVVNFQKNLFQPIYKNGDMIENDIYTDFRDEDPPVALMQFVCRQETACQKVIFFAVPYASFCRQLLNLAC